MSDLGVIGAGAFGTALAIAQARAGRDVTLWGRDTEAMSTAQKTRQVPRLPDVILPENIIISPYLETVFEHNTLLLAIPAQQLRGFIGEHAAHLRGKRLVACCKGIDLETGIGPAQTIEGILSDAHVAILTGPSFAADIAKGLPTALTLACRDAQALKSLQDALSTPYLRLYRTGDVIGAELGGALKNVIAIACGACIGAGFGESARASLMTRGFAEMNRLAAHMGARRDTLSGLSGLGDLALTCMSVQSRNFRLGHAIGVGDGFDPSVTVEGAATAKAVSNIGKKEGLDLPITSAVARLVRGEIDVTTALGELLARPLKEE